MATYDYTLFNPPLARPMDDLTPIIARCLTRVKRSCKAAVVHTLESQIARIQTAQKQAELALTIALDEPSGPWGWMAKRKKIRILKGKLKALRKALLDWVRSIYQYFAA